MNSKLHKQILERATAPYFDTGRFNYRWARGKLRYDPIFPGVLALGIFPDNAKVLDLGCGRGLLASWLLAAEQIAGEGGWPADQPPPPRGLSFRGVELMQCDVRCGKQALSLFGPRIRLEQGDVRNIRWEQTDVVAILDVLHYIDYAEQEALIDNIRTALPAGGMFLTRVGDASAGLPFHFSQWVDRTVSFIHGHRLPRMWCRPLKAWVETLETRGFRVRTFPMSQGTPFANFMIEARL